MIRPTPLRTARPVAVLALLTAAAAWLWAHEGHAPLPSRGAKVDVAKGEILLIKDARAAIDVRWAEVEERAVDDRILAYATLVTPWQRHAFATSRLPGRIARLHAQAGQTVVAGQVLAEVQSLELENLALELRNAQNDVRLSERVVAQLADPNSSGAVPGQTVVEARSKLQQQQNALDVARAKWRGLGLSAADLDALLATGESPVRTLPVRSPVAGTVIHADLTVGKVVEPAEHLFEVVDLSRVWAKIGVLERDLHRVAVGQPVELQLTPWPGEVFRSTVQVRGFALDPQTHLNAAWAEFENPPGAEPRLLPGMAGQAQLILPGKATTKTVPAEAVLGEGAERFVLVEVAGAAGASQFLKRNVVVGRQADGRAAIEAGDIFPGDRVVTQGGHELAAYFVPGVLRLTPLARRGIGLAVKPAAQAVVEEVVDLDGAVDVPPDRRTTAAAQLAGTLHAVLADRGQVVRPGQVLAEIVSLEFQNLQLELLKAHLETQLLEGNLGRLRAAATSVAQRRILDMESAVNGSRNQRASLSRKLESVGLTPAQVDTLFADRKVIATLPIRAPAGGTVVSFDKVLGQAIKSDEPVFEVHDLSHPLVQGYVSERDFGRVRTGQPVRVRLAADPDYVAKGTVARSGRVFGPESRTLSVWVEVPHDPAKPLLHNQLARLTLTVGKPAATLAVSRSAVVGEGTRSFVFVETPDGVFERRPVETGRADDRRVEILAGLRPGEPVAVRGVSELQTAYAGLR